MEREFYLKYICEAFSQFPVVALLGARQVGKTTMARAIRASWYFDLENPRDMAKFNNPQLLLEDLSGIIVVDEIQRKPDLFALLRYLVDRPENKAKFLVLGSASRDLIHQSSETLAGRIVFMPVNGFDLGEIEVKQWKKLWERGSFPLSFLAGNNTQSNLWREQYISTFLERDIPQLGISIPAHTLRRFWTMLSHYHGQLLNYAELACAFGISDMTVRKYIDILSGTFMIHVLQPWHTNMGKRLTKQPKIYLSDSGIFHSLQNIDNYTQLQGHPKLGASFEGFVINQLLAMQRRESGQFFFYRTHQGTELDLFWMRRGKNLGVEIKYADAPHLSKSMQIAMQDLGLDKLWVIYPGKDKYLLSENVEVLPITDLKNIL